MMEEAGVFMLSLYFLNLILIVEIIKEIAHSVDRKSTLAINLLLKAWGLNCTGGVIYEN